MQLLDATGSHARPALVLGSDIGVCALASPVKLEVSHISFASRCFAFVLVFQIATCAIQPMDMIKVRKTKTNAYLLGRLFVEQTSTVPPRQPVT
jgi:hypothetical protein